MNSLTCSLQDDRLDRTCELWTAQYTESGSNLVWNHTLHYQPMSGIAVTVSHDPTKGTYYEAVFLHAVLFVVKREPINKRCYARTLV